MLSRGKKAVYIHSQRAGKEGGRTLISVLKQPKKGKNSSNHIDHYTNPNTKVSLLESQ
jgi:hypothetical protein